MTVTRDQAARIATLARLHFEAADLGRITDELNHILDHVEALRSLEQSSAPPMPDERAPTRFPEAEEPDAIRGGVGAFAPDWREGFFVVPPLPGVHAEDGA
ncbi:MAG: Asp-tRNA(Asn)/Glu-tRNA(Gln) amidotransferase subunit GatC [Longimicrobiales bacterium]